MKDKKNYQFSIIVPVYNVEVYLDKCMESLANQKDAEIIYVDDGSLDNSGRICDEYSEKYEQVRVFHKENGGLSSARNYGMKNAQGKYVLFVDSDDYVETDMCSSLISVLAKYGDLDVVAFGSVEETETRKTPMNRKKRYSQSIISGKEYMIECCQSNSFGVEAWRHLYRREFLEKNDLIFKEGILHEDIEFTPRVLLVAERVLEISDIFYHYIVRENSICTRKDKTKNIHDIFETLRTQVEIAKQQEPELSQWMLNHVLNIYLSTIYAERMYRKEYRVMVEKKFLLGKAATNYNRMRAVLCFLNIRLYCWVNDLYKRIK